MLVIAEGDKLARKSVLKPLIRVVSTIQCCILTVNTPVFQQRHAERAKNRKAQNYSFIKGRTTMAQQLMSVVGLSCYKAMNSTSEDLNNRLEEVLEWKTRKEFLKKIGT